MLGAVRVTGRDDRFDRRRDTLDDQVEQRAHTDVLRRRAARDGIKLAAQNLGVQRLAQLVRRDLDTFEVPLGEVIRDLGDGRDQPVVPLGGLDRQLGRDRTRLGLARAAARILVRDHVQHVDHTAEVALTADRDRDRDATSREALLHRCERALEARTLAVELADEDDPGERDLVAAAPQPAGHDLDAHHAVDREQTALDHPQRAERVGHEARVAGRVEQVELAALPVGVPERARDRHRAAALVVVVI